MRRLLLVTHRSIEQDGGPAARWRAFARYLPEHGWELDVLSAAARAGAAEFEAGSARAVARRATAMARVGRLSEPVFSLAGMRPDALPLSILWTPRGARRVRRWIEERRPDLVLASGPPIAGPLAARIGVPAHVPLVVELRDLWAGSPAFDAGGRTLARVEDWLLHGARRVVACTPEAVCDLRRRHPDLAPRVVEIANGFDPQIRSIAQQWQPSPSREARGRALTLLHSGTLTPARPIGPVIRALGDARLAGGVRLVLHGYLSPTSRAEVEQAGRCGGPPIELHAPAPWADAVRRIAAADAGLITQARAAGDETAVASKVYEYLALGKPVVCVSDGGATEALLRRLGAEELCARLDRPETIVAALLRLREGAVRRPPPERLEAYDRRALASRMAALLEEVASG
ncbi:MAG TPA: glycosyltransferase [Solirubrobacteraceae bacterium]|jgi:glycosyltransferase involved in cell wall biosynthesis|nr:glycosyltransferase [Solirubrobacteraceae bacterium]